MHGGDGDAGGGEPGEADEGVGGGIFGVGGEEVEVLFCFAGEGAVPALGGVVVVGAGVGDAVLGDVWR